MDTKQIGDIVVSKAITKLLKLGYAISMPFGDRLPYDLIVDISGKLIKLQIKKAYKCKSGFQVRNKRTCSNRGIYKFKAYSITDFDYCLVYIDNPKSWYVLPIEIFCSKNGSLYFTPNKVNIFTPYKNNWKQLSQGSVTETCEPHKFEIPGAIPGSETLGN